MTLGERIKMLRERLDLNQYELAKQSKITQATICRLEGDKVFQLKSGRLLPLAKALHVSVSALVGETEVHDPEEAMSHDLQAHELVSTFAQLDAERRTQLREYARFLASR